MGTVGRGPLRPAPRSQERSKVVRRRRGCSLQEEEQERRGQVHREEEGRRGRAGPRGGIHDRSSPGLYFFPTRPVRTCRRLHLGGKELEFYLRKIKAKKGK